MLTQRKENSSTSATESDLFAGLQFPKAPSHQIVIENKNTETIRTHEANNSNSSIIVSNTPRFSNLYTSDVESISRGRQINYPSLTTSTQNYDPQYIEEDTDDNNVPNIDEFTSLLFNTEPTQSLTANSQTAEQLPLQTISTMNPTNTTNPIHSGVAPFSNAQHHQQPTLMLEEQQQPHVNSLVNELLTENARLTQELDRLWLLTNTV